MGVEGCNKGTSWEDNIKLELKEVGLEAWAVLILLRTGIGGGLL